MAIEDPPIPSSEVADPITLGQVRSALRALGINFNVIYASSLVLECNVKLRFLDEQLFTEDEILLEPDPEWEPM